MPERDGYIPGVPCWVDTTQPDPEAAVDFYSGLFGWEFENNCLRRLAFERHWVTEMSAEGTLTSRLAPRGAGPAPGLRRSAPGLRRACARPGYSPL